VRDSWGEPSTQQRFILSVVVASQGEPSADEPADEPADEAADDEKDADDVPAQEDDVVPSDETTPYPLWDAKTVYSGNWGTFETVSWKGHNYQVKWWSQGNQPDLNCGQFDVWKDLGAY
ncbi:chitinase, partial [Escherichia coli]|nr:chitinase [Escherichia coli]